MIVNKKKILFYPLFQTLRQMKNGDQHVLVKQIHEFVVNSYVSRFAIFEERLHDVTIEFAFRPILTNTMF